MPLRAKITNTAFNSANIAVPSTNGSSQNIISKPMVIKEAPGDAPNDVLFNSIYGLRTITLNRPNKLNSLDGSMIRKIVPRLQEWTKSDMANVIVMKGEGRAFCAGGDVAALAKQNDTPEGQAESTNYFAHEYALDHYIATYEKPYVAFIDGITMGGGVGLSVHAPFRIATEKTVFAMPETTIGLFPDVGASFFLPRLDGQLGMYLALTSEQLKGVNVFYARIATHYLHSSSLPDLEARFSELQFRDSDDYQSRLRIINSAIEEFTTGLPHDQPIAPPVAGTIRTVIDYVFQDAHSFDDIMQALTAINQEQAAEEDVKQWAKKTFDTIQKRSPTSCKVTIQQLRKGKTWTINDAFDGELKLASNFMKHHDFVEGVTALLINKPKTEPKWQPADSRQISKADVDNMFTGDAQFRSLREIDPVPYREYPHAWTALPTETAIEAYVKNINPPDQEAVLRHFHKLSNGKLGMKEKVTEVLNRRTKLTRRTKI